MLSCPLHPLLEVVPSSEDVVSVPALTGSSAPLSQHSHYLEHSILPPQHWFDRDVIVASSPLDFIMFKTLGRWNLKVPHCIAMFSKSWSLSLFKLYLSNKNNNIPQRIEISIQTEACIACS